MPVRVSTARAPAECKMGCSSSAIARLTSASLRPRWTAPGSAPPWPGSTTTVFPLRVPGCTTNGECVAVGVIVGDGRAAVAVAGGVADAGARVAVADGEGVRVGVGEGVAEAAVWALIDAGATAAINSRSEMDATKTEQRRRALNRPAIGSDITRNRAQRPLRPTAGASLRSRWIVDVLVGVTLDQWEGKEGQERAAYAPVRRTRATLPAPRP